MAYLTAAVIISGALSVFNMFLALAIIRWIKGRGPAGGVRVPPPRLPSGTEIADFSVTTMSGASHSLSDMRGARSLVAFLSPGCPPCSEQLPEFIRLARADFPDPAQVLAVVPGSTDTVAEFVADLKDVALIANESHRDAAAKAFSASAFPSFYILDEHGKVETSGGVVRSLAVRQLA